MHKYPNVNIVFFLDTCSARLQIEKQDALPVTCVTPLGYTQNILAYVKWSMNLEGTIIV